MLFNNMLKNKAGLTAINLTFVLFYAIIVNGMGGFYPDFPVGTKNWYQPASLTPANNKPVTVTGHEPAL